MTPTEFLKKYGDAFVVACEGTKLFPSVKLAQAALESGWGKYAAGNNLFGIKASNKRNSPYWNGDYVESRTTEYENGSFVPTTRKFRKYASISDSIKDHNYFLQTEPRYANIFNAKTPEEQAQALQDAHYAGNNPDYARRLINIINTYNLKRFDEKKNL